MENKQIAEENIQTMQLLQLNARDTTAQKKKCQEHLQEMKEGCGKISMNEWGCCGAYSSDGSRYCPACQDIIKKYEDVGIHG